MTQLPWNQERDRKRVAEEAVAWVVCLNDERLTPRERAQAHQVFYDWIVDSPLHLEEFLFCSRTYASLSFLDRSPTASELRAGAKQDPGEPENVHDFPFRQFPPPQIPPSRDFDRPRRSRRAFIAAGGAAAASVALVGVIAFHSGRWPRSTISTDVGEQRSVTLADGSVVLLNTHSKVRISLTTDERRVELLFGEARFQVAKDRARPFVVATADADVRAVGTVFNVRAAGLLGTVVAVFEGEVLARSTKRQGARSSPVDSNRGEVRGATVSLRQNDRAAVLPAGEIVRGAGPPLEFMRDWPKRRLTIQGISLANLMTEMNRYRTVPLRIDDARVAAISVNGSFDLSDSESLLQALRQYYGVMDRADPDDGSIVLERKAL